MGAAAQLTDVDGLFDCVQPSKKKGGAPARPGMEPVPPGTPKSRGGSKPSSPRSGEAAATAEHEAEQAATAEAREAAAAEAVAATLLVIGSQRVRLLKAREELAWLGVRVSVRGWG